MRLTRNAVSPPARRAGQRPGQASARGGGIMGRAQRHGRARRRAHGAGRSAYERVIRAYGRAVQLPAIPGGLAVVRVRPANGREGGPARTTAHGHPECATRTTVRLRTADSGRGKANSERCHAGGCAMRPRGPAVRAFGSLHAGSRPSPGRSQPSGTGSRERRSRLIPPQARSPLALDTPAARPRTPPVARPVGAAGPHRTDHPTSLAPTSCGDARPSVPCAAPRG